jgi:VanZ family protein
MKFIKLWLLPVIWAALIFYLSSIPNLGTSLSCDFILRKIAHIAEYFVLTLLLWIAFKGSFGMNTVSLFIYPALVSFLYAALDEFHQSFVPSRSGNIHDVLIDAIGIISFYIVLQIFAAIQKAKQRKQSH